MANLRHEHPNEGWGYDGHWWHDLNVYQNWQDVNGNYSNVTIEIVAYSDNGAYNQSGAWTGQLWSQGGLAANTVATRNISSGGVQIAVWSGNIWHDANGNASPYMEYYVNEPYTSMSRRGSNWGLSRLALAPPITGQVADQIKPTSARIGVEIGGLGHGTSVSMRMYYRIQGVGGYTATADQGDVAGYNYWTLTGLKPGKTYEYYAVTWNNNSDTSTGGVQTFKTKGVAGMAPVLMKLAQG